MEPGDVIVEFNGKPIHRRDELVAMVTSTRPGTTVPVKVLRDKREMSLNVTVDELDLGNETTTRNARRGEPDTEPDIQETAGFGLSLAPLTADMAPSSVNNWFPGFPWDHPENYATRSLLSVVKNVKTPTLIMTGEEDFRTPMSESEQYYKALKMRGVESVLVRVPEEPHGIRRRPSHAASKLTTLAGWFEQHRAPVQ